MATTTVQLTKNNNTIQHTNTNTTHIENGYLHIQGPFGHVSYAPGTWEYYSHQQTS